MLSAQKWMKYNCIGFFCFVLLDILAGGVVIWAYASSFSFDARIMQEILFGVSTNIIFEVLCWSVCLNASHDSSHSTAPLVLGAVGLCGHLFSSINSMMVHGITTVLGLVPMLFLGLYLSTVLAAIKMKRENTVSKSMNRLSQMS